MATPLSPTDDGALRGDSASIAETHLASAQPLLLADEPSDPIPNAQPASRVNSWLSRQTDHANELLASSSLQFTQWMGSVQGRGVLKCSIAYSLASLATFVGPIAGLLGKPEGKHVVATITVYFHAARSTGSMIEAVLIATVAVAYAETVSILSMITSVLVGSQLGLVTLAHVLVVIIFIGGGFGFMGWVKQRMDNPLVNVGSTLASLAIIGVVTKENAVVENVFSNQKIAQVFKMLLMGISTAAAVNLLLWPVSARQQLRASMAKASAALGTMLSDVTASFLENTHADVVRAESTASVVYDRAYAVLRKDLREAKFEHYFVGRERLYIAENSVAKSLKTLSQSIGGLQSAAKTHNGLLRSLQSGAAEGTSSVTAGKASVLHTREADAPHTARQALDLAEAFASSMKSSMDSLSAVLSQVLLEPPFGPHEVTSHGHDNFRFRLTDRLAYFTACRIEALQEIYTAVELERSSASAPTLRPIEEVAASCGHFSFSLQVFGEEMQKYLDVLEDLKAASQQSKRSWQWLKWWRAKSSETIGLSALPFETSENELLVKPSTSPVARPQPMRRRYTYDQDDSAKGPSILVRFSQTILGFARKMARDDSKTNMVAEATLTM